MPPVPLTRDLKPQIVPIEAQISEVRRELAMRADVYGKRVREGKMRQSEADLFTARLEAVLKTLEYMRDHRTVIIAAVAAAKAQPSHGGAG